jgi:Flp pilus assembly pilin Flp
VQGFAEFNLTRGNRMRPRLFKLVFKLRRRLAQDEGQTMIEYALLSALITLGFVALFNNIGNGIVDVYTSISSKIATLVGDM